MALPEIKKAKVVDRPQIGLTEYWIVNIPEYCGKILVQKQGTTCPAHSHKKKHETFLIWSGKVRMVVEGQVYLEGSTSSWGENSDYIELVKKRKPRRNLVYSIT